MKFRLIILLIAPVFASAQPYSNNWIDYNKEYYKISVAENGIYRINYDDLDAVGFPVSSIEPRRIQLFHRGVEVAINVEGESDGVFDNTDYVEFYGQKNDGTLDEELYINPAAQPHRYYNLYSDTTAYFLTYDPIITGLRMSSQSPLTGATPDAYYFNEVFEILTDNYSPGYTIQQYTRLTQFDIGEGFTGPRIREVAAPVFDLGLSGLDLKVISAPNPELEILLVGRNESIHNLEIFVGPDLPGLISIGTYQFDSFNTMLLSESIDWSSLSPGGDLFVRVEVIDDGGIQSNISISYAKIRYARQTDQNNQSFREYELEVKGSGGNVLEIINTLPDTKIFDISNPDNVSIVVDTDVDPTKVTCGFIDATQQRKLAVGVPGSGFNLEKIGRFRAISSLVYDYIIISHNSLMQPAGSVTDAVRAYAGYRASAAGGGFDTLVVDIDQLYNQFNYGEISPMAIYNFMEYMVENGDPKNLLLIGKGLDVSLNYHRSDPATFNYHDLVPPAGNPGSDLPYTAGLKGTTYENYVPTGRLSVSSPQQIINYLDKVIEMESTPYNQLWRKNILHLSGGNSQLEQSLFKAYTDGFKAIANGYYLGGEVTSVSKATTSTVEYINVSEEVNNGLNLITFFGHSAPNVTDIDIGLVSDPINGYLNQGKYPVLLMNGCNAGNIYGNSYIFGEDWVVTANKGATAVIAHTSYGYPFFLKIWTNAFYNLAYGDTTFIEKSIGEIQIEVGKKLIAELEESNYMITQIQQMGLQGDPAVKLFGTRLPDYEIKSNNIEAISFNDQGITSSSDSFALELIIPNYGAFVSDSLDIYVKRTLEDGRVIDSVITYSPVAYSDTLIFTINNQVPNNTGSNLFEITLDPLDKINELNKLNNSATYSLNIQSAGTINLYPTDFSIQSEQDMEFMVQSGSALAVSRGYQLELDSTFLFTSPFKQIGTVNGEQPVPWKGGNVLSVDSLAYYWRSKYESTEPNETDDWTTTSFTYITGSNEGWAQVEFHQMIENKLEGLILNEGARRFDFKTVELPIEVKVHGANSPDYTYEDTELLIDDLPYIYPGSFTLCGNNRLHIVAFNQENAAPYAPVSGIQTDSWTCGRAPQVINSYPAGKTLDEILDAIRMGDKVVIFTTGSFDFNSLTADQISKMEEIGADALVLGAKLPEEPYILVGYKGAGSMNAYEEIVADPSLINPTDEQSISFIGEIVGSSSSGKIESPVIGPAVIWDELLLKVDSEEISDNHSLKVIGRSFEGEETVLYSNQLSGKIDISGIDPAMYPYLRLELNISDDIAKTAPQLDKWLITYRMPAEGMISYLDNSEGTLPVVIEEGKELTTRFIFKNISDKDFTDSLTVEFSITNHDQKTKTTQVIGRPPLLSSGSDTIEVKFTTKGLVGNNSLEVFVNPFIIPEQVYQNNLITLQEYFTVTKDATNPQLDVTFDGEYIFDGDIVSPNPHIRISIDDDNPYLFKSDTTGIDIFLTRPCENCVPERIALSGSEVSWTPETDSESFVVNYEPRELEDGVYLLSVQAEDESGNKSGVEPYKIHFEVINQSTITNFYPYPNPFSTSVRFVFTLTGNDAPDQIMIRIFTVSGRVVREITQDELGTLRIGNNMTDYAWDGRDEFGDQLANGVYLYKVYLKIKGEDVELRQSAGDKGFEKGYGKLYLLR